MAAAESMDVDGGPSIARTTGPGAGAGAGARQPQPERPNWRPPRPRLVVAYATSSSTSGSLSTTYTSGSSHLQSSSSDGDPLGLPWPAAVSTLVVDEIATKLERLQLPLLELEEEREKMRGNIRGFVQEFSAAAAGDDEDATALVLERWFSDLSVSWVLSIDTSPAGAFIIAPRRLQHLARSWVVALMVIQLSIFTYFDGLCNQVESTFSASEFARFLQSIIFKTLPFVDVVVSAKVIGPCIDYNLSSNREATVTAEEKLQTLLGMRDVLSAASEQIQMWPTCPPFQGSRGIIDQTSSLLSAKLAKLDEAVWNTLDEIRTSIITPLTDDSMDPQTLRGRSPDVYKATVSIVNCIKALSTDYGLARQIVSKAASLGKYVPQDSRTSLPFSADPLATLVMEMISCLQEHLARVSQSFPDQSLRFLFLLNNTHFIWQQLHHPSYSVELYMPVLTRKIDDHVQRYLQMSWIPVVSGLHDPTPLCLGRNSPLAKFETEFEKTYTAQKLWKVPDPELRRRLRKAIIETVIPAFTKYLEDNKMTAPRVTQQELLDTLQDLFEG